MSALCSITKSELFCHDEELVAKKPILFYSYVRILTFN